MAMAVGHCRKSHVMWMPLVIGLALVAASGGGAVTLNVPSDAYPTIQAGIDGAAAGDVVVVAAGRYKENIDFNGKAITVQSSNPTSPAVVAATIIDGDQKGSVVTFNSGETAASVLRGLTITNGSGTRDEFGQRRGAGLYCDNASPTLTRNIISGNSMSYDDGYGEAHLAGDGGGLYCGNSSATLTDNTLSGNSAYNGGGVYCISSSPTLTNNTISDNCAYWAGGGVYCGNSSATLTSNTISGNSAIYGGGGVECNASSPTITRNTISGNTGGSGGGVYYVGSASGALTNNAISDNLGMGQGGGVNCYYSSPKVTGNTISGNWARYGSGGGGVYCEGEPSPAITNNTISNNSAGDTVSVDNGGCGGGVCCIASSPVLTDNTISGNSAGPGHWAGGGGVYCSGSPVLTHNTISNNSAMAGHGGGGVLCSGSATLTDNTIRGNSAIYGGGVCCYEADASALTHNTISGNSAAAGGGVCCYGYETSPANAPTPTNNRIAGLSTRSGGWARGYGYKYGPGKAPSLTKDTSAGNSPTLTNNTISGNSTTGGYGGGGVLCAFGTSAALNNNTISDNVATVNYGSGGGVCFYQASPTLTHNTIGGNSAYCGGGLCCDTYSSPSLANNIISGNSAAGGFGGGVECWDNSSPALTNNTISGNGATYGGGLYCIGESAPVIRNTVIAFSGAGGGLYIDATEYPDHPSKPIITYSDVYGNVGGEYVNWPDLTGTNGNIGLDPCFVSAAQSKFYLRSQAGHWNGAAWVNDTVTSPCIDAGDPASPFASEPAPNGGRINMGYDGDSAHASKTQVLTAPTAVTIAPTAPGPEDLQGTATGSTCAAGRTMTYRYHWAKQKADGSWDRWSYTGQTLPAARVKIGETWRVRAQASDGVTTSAWKVGSSATIVSMAGLTPAPKTYGVRVTTCVFASFRWPVQQASVTTRVQLKRGTTVVPSVMTWVTAERKVKLRPKAALLPDTYYRINLDPGIVCAGGRTLGWGENYWFKTAPAATAAAVSVAAAPTAAGAQVTVNLSSAATVRTVICNIAGRVVAELGERDLPAGLTSLAWNGKGGSGTRVPAGTYLVRVEAKGSEGAQATAVTALQIR